MKLKLTNRKIFLVATMITLTAVLLSSLPLAITSNTVYYKDNSDKAIINDDRSFENLENINLDGNSNIHSAGSGGILNGSSDECSEECFEGSSEIVDDIALTVVVQTEKQLYLVNESVMIIGKAFNPETQIIITISRPCCCGMHDSHEDVLDNVYTDINGVFLTNYDNTKAEGAYNFTATDGINEAESIFVVSSYAIWTDKTHYGLNQTVNIYGAGFNSNALINMNVFLPDNSSFTWELIADAYGNFTTTYDIGEIAGNYYISASDGYNNVTILIFDEYITVSPLIGYVGDLFTINGYGFKGSGGIYFRRATGGPWTRIGSFSSNYYNRFTTTVHIPSWVQWGETYLIRAYSAVDVYYCHSHHSCYSCGQTCREVCVSWFLIWCLDYETRCTCDYCYHCHYDHREYFDASYPVYIGLRPVAVISAPSTAFMGETVQFSGSGSYDLDGAIISYLWDFDDGSFSSIPNPTHVYTKEGTYYVRLTVTDNHGFTHTRIRAINIEVPLQAPIADAGGPYLGYAGEITSFDGGGSSDPDGSIVFYYWTFGDGQDGTGKTPDHIYTKQGTYMVTLTVWDDDNLYDIDWGIVTIIDRIPPTTTISLTGARDLNGKYVTDVTVELTAVDYESDIAEIKYSLDGSTWTTYTEPFTVEGPGTHMIYYYSIDIAGNVEETKTEEIKIGGVIYIRSDGTIDPSTAPIIIDNNVYTFTANIYARLVVKKNNIVIDGDGHLLYIGGGMIGIDLHSRSNVIIKNLELRDFTYGIYLDHSSNNVITGNTLTNIGSIGILLQYSSDSNTVSENYIRNSWEAIKIRESTHNIITQNIISNNRYGIELHTHANYNTISNNLIANITYYGIWLAGPFGAIDSNIISENTISRCQAGIMGWRAIYNTISKNTITICSLYAIWFYECSHNSINENIIIQNKEGILVDYNSSYNKIFKNVILNNWRGLRFARSSKYNLIYHNSFIGNAVQASDANPAENDWYETNFLEGNYWSNYPGKDNGSGSGKHSIAGDFIGDTNLPWNYDEYPFVLTAISLSGVQGDNYWYTSDVSATLQATELFTSIVEIEYSLDGSNWIAYTTPLAILDEGITSIYYRSIDNYGNIEPTRSASIKIDKTLPETEIIFEPPYIDNDNVYILSETEFELVPFDEHSGVAHTYYRIDEGAWSEYTAPFTLGDIEGPRVIEYKSIDNAGNLESINSITVIMDLTPPDITILYQDGDGTDGNPGKWSVFAYDDISGINEDSILILIDGIPVGNLFGEYNVPNNLEEHIVYVEVENNILLLGSNSGSVNIIDDDIEAPEIYVEYDGDYTDGNPGNITVTATDPSGLGENNMGVYAVPAEPGTYYWTFIATDNDNDRPDDNLTSVIDFSITIFDDDITSPTINEVLIENPILNDEPTFWIKIDATDASGIENVIVLFEGVSYATTFDGVYYRTDLTMTYLGGHLISVIVTDADNDVPNDESVTVGTYSVFIEDGILDQTTISIDIVVIELNHNMEMNYGFDVIFEVYADHYLNSIDYDIDIEFLNQKYEQFGRYQAHILIAGTYPIMCTVTNTLGDSISTSKDVVIDEIVMKALILKQLDELNDLIDNSEDSDWIKKNYKKTLKNKINALIYQILDDEYEGAYDKLLHDLKPLLTGLKTDEWETAWGDAGVFNNPWTTNEELVVAFQYEINPTLWVITQLF